MLDNNEVISEGFKPLVKTASTAQSSKSFNHRGRSMSINAETGEKESAKDMWEGSSFLKMEKMRSFGMTLERSNTFGPVQGDSSSVPVVTRTGDPGCIVIVDPFSTGAHLASEVCKAGLKCCQVLSIWDSPVASLVQQGLTIDFCATIQFNDRLEYDLAFTGVLQALKELPFPILAVIPGAETGVELADQLSSKLGLRSNGTSKSLARRNKYFMGEEVRKAGVRAVKQAMCTNAEELKSFVSSLTDGSCVVKPVQSAGSDDVFLCSNVDEALEALSRIVGTTNGIGLHNSCVLVQEFLKGKEYVVDKVSRNGVHKIVAVWQYEKRSANGANFVYFGNRLMSSDSELSQTIIHYADLVLDALDIKEGPSHMEVMVDTKVDELTGAISYIPCLVEVGARCQGGEGTWLLLVKESIGYSQVDVTLDCYLDGILFDRLHKDSYPKIKAAREVDMVARASGIVRKLTGDAFIRSLPSFRQLHWDVKPGDFVKKTVDCFTRPGCVELVADTEEEVERDFEAIHAIEELGLIDYSVMCPHPPSIGAVVVVDPFSSGANLAAMVLLWGYKLILVFSERDSPVAKLVTKGSKVEPTLMVQHDNTHPNQTIAVQQTLNAITHYQGVPILAIIPGAETGVLLADQLAALYGTRCNGTELASTRRDKYKMQEALRATGSVRAVQQQLCRSEAEVKAFLLRLVATSPGGSLKCVLKPNESAGTDSVFLCNTEDEAVRAFHSIHGQINGLGQINDGALCQEFLSGVEYVVDGVSRDGIYKVVAIWEYDKRSVNGANFVYFGMSLRDTSHPKIRAIVDYAKQVVNGLKIHQGPSHMEIICTEVVISNSPGQGEATMLYSPCLVEVGTRCHGGEATWLPVAMECIGYTMLDATLNCYLRPDRFDELPFEPSLKKSGAEAFLVSLLKGTLKDIPGMEVIRSLSSFRKMELLTQPGSPLYPTIDCFTRPGSVQLVHVNAGDLMADYQVIRQLELDGLFELL